MLQYEKKIKINIQANEGEKMSLGEICFRVILAMVIAGPIGYEREFKNRPAGIRTHILVCLGAVIIALIQTQLTLQALDYASKHPEVRSLLRIDQSRLVAQVVSGIGFLGAGTIIVTKRTITGLTTAASLWSVAGLGIAIGLGFYKIAILGFIGVLTALYMIKKVIHVPSLKKLEIHYVHRNETKEFITQYFEAHQIKTLDVDFNVDFKKDRRVYANIYTVELPTNLTFTEVIEEISAHKNVTKMRLISI